MKYLWAARSKIYKRLEIKKQKLLILDFDGTLTPIAKTPQEVVLKRRTKETLSDLSRLPGCQVAIVSGRSLKDLMSYFRFKNVVYVGNHGLELKGKGLSLPLRAMKGRKMKALVWLLGQKLKADLSQVPGIMVEDKDLTLSLHYRNIPRGSLPFFKKKVEMFKKKYSHWPVRWTQGKKVWEVRPGTLWGKGDIALFLVSRFARAFPIVIGDDKADEEMFRMLKRRALTIRVGRRIKSAADYYLNSPGDVGRFLGQISHAKD